MSEASPPGACIAVPASNQVHLYIPEQPWERFQLVHCWLQHPAFPLAPAMLSWTIPYLDFPFFPSFP